MVSGNSVLDPAFIKQQLEMAYDTIAANDGEVSIEIITIDFKGQAGGETVIGGGKEKITIWTIPQASWAWQTVLAAYRDPWTQIPFIYDYVKKNNLLKEISDGDDVVRKEIWEKFRQQCLSWGFAKIWNVVGKYYIPPEPKPQPKPAPKPKPIHKNKPFMGGLAITIASMIIAYLHTHLPAPLATAVAGLVVMVLAALEHTDYRVLEKEIEEESS